MSAPFLTNSFARAARIIRRSRASSVATLLIFSNLSGAAAQGGWQKQTASCWPAILACQRRYWAVDEAVLGGPSLAQTSDRAFASVPILSVAASAGPGSFLSGEAVLAHYGFDRRWLKSISRTPDQLSIISVRGDSMQPTLAEGDDILVDMGDAAAQLRDGIYVLRVDEVLLVKRLALSPANGSISIRSDNPAYPAWEECAASDIQVIGRVIWAGRRLS